MTTLLVHIYPHPRNAGSENIAAAVTAGAQNGSYFASNLMVEETERMKSFLLDLKMDILRSPSLQLDFRR